MVDAVLLVVDAAEGTMPQTRFVLRKALELGLKPIVVVNKVDRPDARPHQVIDEVFDLMVDLGATDEQLDFPIVYTSAKHGFARREVDHTETDVRPLLDAILVEVPEPGGDPAAPLQLLVASLDYDNYLGRLLIGRIVNGTIRPGQQVSVCKLDGSVAKAQGREAHGVRGAEARRGRGGARPATSSSSPGIDEVTIGETLADLENPVALAPDRRRRADRLDDVPRERLAVRRPRGQVRHEPQHRRAPPEGAAHERRDARRGDRQPRRVPVSGRGELHLAITRRDDAPRGLRVRALAPAGHPQGDRRRRPASRSRSSSSTSRRVAMGTVIEKLGQRKAEMTNMTNHGSGRVRIEFQIPTRGLFGYRNEFLTDTKGEGLLYHVFHGYEPFKGEVTGRGPGRARLQGGGRDDGALARAARGALDALPAARRRGLRRDDLRRERAARTTSS